MAIRKAMSKKTDPPAKKQTSATGPYKSGMKTDKSVGVRKITTPSSPKAKGGSQFLPKGIPAGDASKAPLSKQNTQSGTYYSDDLGRVGRAYGKNVLETMDTTGYGKGKKEFEVKRTYDSGLKATSKLKRSEVPSKIQDLKKGATREVTIKGGFVKNEKKK